MSSSSSSAPPPAKIRKTAGFNTNSASALTDLRRNTQKFHGSGVGVTCMGILISDAASEPFKAGSTNGRNFRVVLLAGAGTNPSLCPEGHKMDKANPTPGPINIPHAPQAEEKKEYVIQKSIPITTDLKTVQVPRMDDLQVKVGDVISFVVFGDENFPAIPPKAGDLLTIEGLSYSVRKSSAPAPSADKKVSSTQLKSGYPVLSFKAAEVIAYQGSINQQKLDELLQAPGAEVLTLKRDPEPPIQYDEADFIVENSEIPPVWGLSQDKYLRKPAENGAVVCRLENGYSQRANFYLQAADPSDVTRGVDAHHRVLGRFMPTPVDEGHFMYENPQSKAVTMTLGTMKGIDQLSPTGERFTDRVRVGILEFDPNAPSSPFERGYVTMITTETSAIKFGVHIPSMWVSVGPVFAAALDAVVIANFSKDSAGGNKEESEDDALVEKTWFGEAWCSLVINWASTLKYAGVRVSAEFAKSVIPKKKPAVMPGGPKNLINEEYAADPDSATLVNLTLALTPDWDGLMDPENGWQFFYIPTKGVLQEMQEGDQDPTWGYLRSCDAFARNEAGDLASNTKFVEGLRAESKPNAWNHPNFQLYGYRAVVPEKKKKN